MANSPQKEWLFPSITNKEKAKQVARQGTWAAGIVALITLVLTVIVISENPALPYNNLPKLDAWAFWDVGIFVAIAWGIYKMSRVAAVAGLVIYIAEQVLIRVSNPKLATNGIFFTVLIVIAFINGIRGTFAYHSLPPSNTNIDPDPES